MNKGIKDRIADSWLSMAKSRSPDKITVQEISSSCGISRQTFYKYCQDIIDVMRWSFEREVRNAYSECMKIDDSDRAMEFFITRVIENDKILRRAMGSSFHGQTREICESAFRRIVEEDLCGRASGFAVKQSDMKILADFCTHGLMGLFMQYCADSEIDIPDFSAKVNRLINSAVKFLTQHDNQANL